MTNPKIRVRSYNVGFGDCFLVSIPDGDKTRHLLIDFGNAPGKGGSNARFKPIAENIQKETNGSIDAIVMTHEHLDHMEGFYSQRKIFDRMNISQVWMSLPSDPKYYADYPAAKEHKRMKSAARAFANSLESKNAVSLAPSFEALLLNNLNNKDRVEYLRNLGNVPPLYLRRGSTINSLPASKNIKFRVLAPEKDMSVYYRRSSHYMALMSASLAMDTDSLNRWSFPNENRVSKPLNINDSDWADLHHSIQTGAVDAVRSIDKAENNTSLVFVIETHGKRLLFSGDAELESWEIMMKKSGKYLNAMDFLKISHHGSHNGTHPDVLDLLLPKENKSNAQVLVSTRSKIYGTKHPVPDESLLTELRTRCKKLHSTDKIKSDWLDVYV